MSASPILTYGFGSFGGAEYVPTLGFGIGDALEEYEPTVHYHDAVGPSSEYYVVVGPSAEYYSVDGAS